MIESREIKMSPRNLLSVLFFQYGTPWLIIALIGIVSFLILGTVVDYRFFILILIWIFLILPLLLTFLYFYHGFKPLTVLNTVVHHILFMDSEFKIRILIDPCNEGEDNTKKFKDFVYKNEDIDFIRSGGNYVILLSTKQGLLWLPMEAFESRSEFLNVVKKFEKI